MRKNWTLHLKQLWIGFLIISYMSVSPNFNIPFNSTFVKENILELIFPDKNALRCSDIVGQKKAKEIVALALQTLRGNDSHLKSFLLKGLPGSGKTFIAKALAGEAKAIMMRIRVSEELLFGQNDFELSFGIKNRLELILAKAREVSLVHDTGVVILIDNLDTALNDYFSSQVIKDMSPQNSYACMRAKLRSSFFKMIEKNQEADDRIVIVACVSETEKWNKPYPREFESTLDAHIESKFQEIVVTQKFSEEEVVEFLNKEIKSRSMQLSENFDTKVFAKKATSLTPKEFINFINRAVSNANDSHRECLCLEDFDLSGIEEKKQESLGLFLKEFSSLTSGVKYYAKEEILENFSNVVVPPELSKDFSLLVSFLKNAEKFKKFNAQPPLGVLFFGDSQTGKTALAKAVAGQAEANLIFVNCNNFMGRFYEVFSAANRAGQPTVVLLDDVDNLSDKGMFSSMSPGIKSLLDELDAFSKISTGGVMVLATAKTCNIGGQSLFKVGRFEKILEIGVPCPNTLVKLLQDFIAERQLKLTDDFLLADVARSVMGMSRGQLFDMANRAAIRAVEQDREEISLTDFEVARSAVMADGEVIKNVKNDDSFGASMRGDEKFFQSPGKFYPPSSVETTFKDVAGCDQAKEQLKEIVNFLSNPEEFKKCGAKVPSGILMIGDPGTGKTLLARAVAGEAGCPFISVSASKFDDMYVGVGKNRIEALFKQARRYSPCLVFIDEIDAVGKRRSNDSFRGSDQTINQLLAEMDGFDKSDKAVVVIAATNRADTLDPAVKRSGRFDRKVIVDLPNVEAREKILAVHAKKIKLSSEVDLKHLAKVTIGASGADLATMINEAALKANREKRLIVETADLEWARDFVIMGGENRFLMKSKENLRQTAYHEAGHALVRLLLPDASPLHKITVVPRGQALGITWSMPDEEDPKSSKEHYLAEICTAMGGRAAEELIFGKAFSGVISDLEKATNIATRMVKNFGMSGLGPIFLNASFEGRESEKTKEMVDAEIHKILQQAYADTLELLTSNKAMLVTLAEALLEQETLSEEDAKKLLKL